MDNNEIKGSLNALKESSPKENKEVSTSSSSETETSSGIAHIMTPPEKKAGLKLKGFYFKLEQIENIEKYSKKSGKSQSEFVRDAIDFVIGELKKNDY